MNRWLASFLLVAIASFALSCDVPPPAADRAKVGVILRAVVAEYEKPGFALAMEQFSTPYDQLRYAVSLQEMVAARHGLTYNRFIRALHASLPDKEVQDRLARAKELIKAQQKKNEQFTKTLEMLEQKGTIAPD